MTGTPRIALALVTAAAVTGQLAFGGVWWLLGTSHPGYDQARDTISVLAAHGAPGWPVMVVAICLSGVAHGACALLMARRGSSDPIAAVLAAVMVASVITAAARIDCSPGDRSWCTAAGDHPLSGTVHAVAAAVVFAGLLAAAVLGAVRPPAVAGPGQPLIRWLSAAALAVALPHLVWFTLQLPDPGPWFGYAEKAYLMAMALWSAAVAVVIGHVRARG